ncbi:hypothetical protein [Marinobacterium sp. xm-d-564]|uniref:hypothetical protein n=1 Tax=Marinobacterium sp. xm-d-564 TaxID=2497742 RepID=UPI001569343F|nr:hypothetical protein [Marinobacterium sp. xm-d-564]NRP58443.1 hypothetical protein [Marinobacterium sp. xm-d-564]
MTAKGGPKTKEGKEISAQNSLKHGLTAKGFINELENANHNSLVQKLNDEYAPKGTIESILIEDLAMIRVQLARFKDVEAALFLNSQGQAEFASSLVDSLQLSDERTRQDLINAINTEKSFIDAKHQRVAKWLSTLDESNINEAELSEEIKTLIKNELRTDCIERDIRPLELIEHLEKMNTDPNAPLCIIRLMGVTPNAIKLEKAERDTQLKQINELQMRDYVTAKKVESSQNITKQKLLDRALAQKRALVDAALPAPGEIDRLYRYRTTLEKQFSNKLSQLIQLQEMRERKERQKGGGS